MATPGFAFANPKPSPDDYNEFDPQDVAADSSVAELPVTEVIPAPWKIAVNSQRFTALRKGPLPGQWNNGLP